MIEARFRIERGTFTLDVDLAIPSAGVTAVFGPSGCGKTTLLRAIAGLDKHAGGGLRVGDLSWQDDSRFVPPHLRTLGYVFQEASLFPHLTVQKNLEYGAGRVPPSERRFALQEAIDLLGIEHLLDRRPEFLSGGERQRVAIARALAVSPRLLLMDEPLAGLDVERKNEILPYFESLHRELEIPVIYVTHSRDEVARLADHLVLLEDGRVSASGAINSVLTRLDLPLSHAPDAEAIVDARIASHDNEYRLTEAEFEGGRFTVPHLDLAVATPVRVRVAARDVSLTLERQYGTSILNIFPATVDELSPEGSAQVTARLTVGRVAILARVTRKSADLLKLEPGKSVFAQVKSVALLS